MTAIVRIDDASTAVWQEAYDRSPAATFFHSPAWGALWQAYTSGRWRPTPLRVTFADGRTAVLVRTSRLVPNDPAPPLVMSAAAGTFGGWVDAGALTTEHGALLRDVLIATPNLAWRVSPYDANAQHAVVGIGDAQETMAVDLGADFEAAWRDRGKGGMLRAVRKATRAGLRTRLASGPDDWDAYFSLYRLSVTRWGTHASSIYERSLFGLLAALDPKDARLWLTCHGDVPVAGAVIVYSPNHAIYWHGAADSRWFGERPVNLLMHDAMLDARTRGLRWFDFNPSGNHEGVVAFKRSCGADPLPAPVVRTPAVPQRATACAS